MLNKTYILLKLGLGVLAGAEVFDISKPSSKHAQRMKLTMYT